MVLFMSYVLRKSVTISLLCRSSPTPNHWHHGSTSGDAEEASRANDGP